MPHHLRHGLYTEYLQCAHQHHRDDNESGGLYLRMTESTRAVRKPPLINRGYYTRHQCIASLIAQFRDLCQQGKSGCQLLNLGAGFDTTYWHLKEQVCSITFHRDLPRAQMLPPCISSVSVSRNNCHVWLRMGVREGSWPGALA